MQKHVNLLDLVKSFPTNIYLQILASIQKRTSPTMCVNLAEKSETAAQPAAGVRSCSVRLYNHSTGKVAQVRECYRFFFRSFQQILPIPSACWNVYAIAKNTKLMAAMSDEVEVQNSYKRRREFRLYYRRIFRAPECWCLIFVLF